MNIDLTTIDTDRFDLVRDEVRCVTLIKPKNIMTGWQPHELWFRSLEVDDSGCVVSAGFPKFFNFGERPEDNDKLLRAERFNVRPKYDGTLIICTNGHCRTRGQTHLGSFYDAVVEAGMPKGRPGVSELYELLGPVSRQVVDYGTQHRLVKLAEVDLANMTLTLCVKPVVTAETPKDLLARVKSAGLDQGEGFVVDVGDYLVKVKSDSYRKAHAFRSGATRSGVRNILAEARVTDRAEALEVLTQAGCDFETLTSVSLWVDEYLTDRYFALCAFERLWSKVSGMQDRKAVALEVQAADPRMMCAVMAMFNGQRDRANKALAAVVLDVGANTLNNAGLWR